MFLRYQVVGEGQPILQGDSDFWPQFAHVVTIRGNRYEVVDHDVSAVHRESYVGQEASSELGHMVTVYLKPVRNKDKPDG